MVFLDPRLDEWIYFLTVDEMSDLYLVNGLRGLNLNLRRGRVNRVGNVSFQGDQKPSPEKSDQSTLGHLN